LILYLSRGKFKASSSLDNRFPTDIYHSYNINNNNNDNTKKHAYTVLNILKFLKIPNNINCDYGYRLSAGY